MGLKKIFFPQEIATITVNKSCIQQPDFVLLWGNSSVSDVTVLSSKMSFSRNYFNSAKPTNQEIEPKAVNADS